MLTDFQGITTKIKFEANGEVQSTSLIVNLFQQKKGQIHWPWQHQRAEVTLLSSAG